MASLAFVLLVPLVLTSIGQLGDIENKYELCENFPGESQSDDRESGEREQMSDIEEFIFHDQHDLVTLVDGNSKSLSRKKEFVSIGSDVLTPPPEFI